MSRAAGLLVLCVALPAVLAAAPADDDDPCAEAFCAGAASVDMTWHTGAGQGQLGSAGHGLTADKFDPFHHSTKMVPTDGFQSRAYAKAVVLSGADGTKAAYVKTELYLQQDMLWRRVAELTSGADPTSEFVVEGLDAAGIILGGTHNHSAPHHISTAWGVWLFADAFDYRQFEDTARSLARAIREADEARRPARVGASVTRLDTVQRNIIGPATADDGSPAGFRRDHFDDELAVIRIDALGDGGDGAEPIAALVNFGNHPESIGGDANLLSADFVGMVERDVERGLGRDPGDERGTGPVVAWSQGGLGDVEPDQSQVTADAEYWRRDFAQAERMSRDITAAVLATWADVAAGTPDVAEKFVPFTTDPQVAMTAERFAGPLTHPVPTVSNCRTERPGVPIAGLPDCRRVDPPPGYGVTAGLLRDAGLPVPDNYGAPAYTAVQETLTIHLQALRVGDILLATCPCEPITDMVLNFKSRADALTGNQHLGFEWECRDGGDQAACDFRQVSSQAPDWRPVDPDAVARMYAQIRNDAAGWEDDLATLQGAHEPDGTDGDYSAIYGNFTHDELTDGYTLPLMVGMANDYIGYVVTNREYQRGDHYRKALTAFGPRTSDYVNTRLVALAHELRGGPPARDVTGDALPNPVEPVDEVLGSAKARILGAGGTAGVAAYEAALPDDGGTPGLVVEQPAAVIERFGAATFTWQGGSNYTDNPEVVVQRRRPDGAGEAGDAEWQTVATQEGGEVVLTLAYDSWRSTAPLDWLTGGRTYEWTATFEVFDATAPGEYRFAVAGDHRTGREPVAYELTSHPFEVRGWGGITVTDLVADRDAGTVSFGVAGVERSTPADRLVGPIGALAGNRVRYPSSYASDIPFLDETRSERGAWRYCFRCSFRPWASHGRIVDATVTVVRAGQAGGDRSGGPRTRTHLAVFDGERFVVRGLELGARDLVRVDAGAVIDEFGNTNRDGVEVTP